jgi:hypothetical protein
MIGDGATQFGKTHECPTTSEIARRERSRLVGTPRREGDSERDLGDRLPLVSYSVAVIVATVVVHRGCAGIESAQCDECTEL